MAPSPEGQRLNELRLRGFRALFATLSPPETGSVEGIYEAEFVGPWWVRSSAPASLALVGLGGWWGKELDGQGGGWNLVRRAGRLRRVLRIDVGLRSSLIDGKPALVVSYSPVSRKPWPWIVDELRRYGTKSLLGMTLARGRIGRRSPFPFLLHACPRPNGS